MKAQISTGAARARLAPRRLRRRRRQCQRRGGQHCRAARADRGAEQWRLDRDRQPDARGRLPHGQSRRAGEAGRICLADLPALRRILGRRRPAACATPMSARGQVSWEFRNFLLIAPDLGLSLLAALPAAGRLLPHRSSSSIAQQTRIRRRQSTRPRGRSAPARCRPSSRSRRSPGRWTSTPSSPAAACPRRGSTSASPTRRRSSSSPTCTDARRTERRRHRHADLLHQRRAAAGRSTGRRSSRCCARRSAAEMKRRAFLAALAAARAARAAGRRRRRPAPRGARSQRDWTQTVVAHARGRLPDGQSGRAGEGDRISLAHLPALRRSSTPRAPRRLFPNYVRTGRVSIEYRNILINGLDVAATCSPAARARARLFRDEPRAAPPPSAQWLGRVDGADRGAARAAATRCRRLRAAAAPRRRCSASTGSPRATASRRRRSSACLANQASLDRLERDAARPAAGSASPARRPS